MEQTQKGTFSTELKHGFHRVEISTKFPVLVSLGNDIVDAVGIGKHTLVIRNRGGRLSIDPSDPKGVYGLSIKSRDSQKGEAFDDLAPPDPAPPNSYLAKLRLKVKNSMGIIREEFADRKTMYEVVDNLDEFEEERHARQQAEAKGAGEKAGDGGKGTRGGDSAGTLPAKGTQSSGDAGTSNEQKSAQNESKSETK